MREKRKGGADIKAAIDEMRRLYEQKRGSMEKVYEQAREKIAEKHVRITEGSSVDRARRDYERKERVAHDIRKDVPTRKRGEEGE